MFPLTENHFIIQIIIGIVYNIHKTSRFIKYWWHLKSLYEKGMKYRFGLVANSNDYRLKVALSINQLLQPW